MYDKGGSWRGRGRVKTAIKSSGFKLKKCITSHVQYKCRQRSPANASKFNMFQQSAHDDIH